MNKMFKIKILSLLICMCTIVTFLPVSALEVIGNNSFDVELNARKQIVFTEKITEMENNHLQMHEEEGAISLSISEIKYVYDFVGNPYTLVELEPQGYILFHDESGVFVEYSSRALSPYLGIYDELYYAGPKDYFTNDLSRSDSEYRHTVMDRTLSEDDIVDYDYVGVSERLNDALMTEKNDNIVNYIQKNMSLQEYDVLDQLKNSGFSQDIQEYDEGLERSTTYNGMTVVNNYTFFTRLNNCGYISGGKCGYIAAGMLLAYRQSTYGETYFPSSYLTWACSGGVYKPSISTSLPTALYNTGVGLGYGNSTTSREIRFTINKYLSDNGYSAVSYIDDWVPLANNLRIADCISNDKPVIWFGEIINNTFDSQTWIQHAIVVYGFSFSILGGYSYMAHFGWTNATEVYFTGVLGSMYTCWR